MFDPRDQSFHFRSGPVFAQLVLGDEINRAPPKTQAALLEAMQERQVTVDGISYKLPAVFTVFATQNPVEQEGTYPLPEAQLDRFMMKVIAEYPSEAGEVEILRVHQRGIRIEDLERFGLETLGGEPELLAAQEEIRSRTIRDELLGYIARLVRATRDNLKVEVGASPRAGLMVLTAAKARAALRGRPHVLPDDIKAIAHCNRSIARVDGNVQGGVQVVYGDKNANTQVTGALPVYEDMRNAHPYYGRFFTEAENRLHTQKAILNWAVS